MIFCLTRQQCFLSIEREGGNVGEEESADYIPFAFLLRYEPFPCFVSQVCALRLCCVRMLVRVGRKLEAPLVFP